jgi:hypothetical protein
MTYKFSSYKTMEKKLKRRQEVEGKTRRSRGESPSQEDEGDRPQ